MQYSGLRKPRKYWLGYVLETDFKIYSDKQLFLFYVLLWIQQWKLNSGYLNFF